MDEKLTIESDLAKQVSDPVSVKAVREPNAIMLTGIWMLALSLVLLAGYLGWRVQYTQAAPMAFSLTPTPTAKQPEVQSNPISADMPGYYSGNPEASITRRIALHTNIPTRSRTEVIEYTVTTGDSVFGIAQSFNLQPETILWANYDQLNDSPDMLSPGMELNIPPVDGVYYQWQVGDTFDLVASEFDASGLGRK